MTGASDIFNDSGTLFGRLRAAHEDLWQAYCCHEFVSRIGDASLPEENFRYYLLQDYLFLIHFSRAWALAVFKSDTLEEMRAAASALDAHLNREINLHIRFCAGWGITEEEISLVEEARANMAYTRYVLDRGLSGDLLDLHVALSPCMIGYGVIGRNLVNEPAVPLAENPYREWIEMYGGEEYRQVAEEAVRHLDRLAASRLGPGRFESLSRTFREATSLEIGFWEMGLKMQE